MTVGRAQPQDVEDAEDDEDDMDPDQEDIVMPLRARPAAAGAAPPEAKPNLTLESDDADRANNPRPAKMRRGEQGPGRDEMRLFEMESALLGSLFSEVYHSRASVRRGMILAHGSVKFAL